MLMQIKRFYSLPDKPTLAHKILHYLSFTIMILGALAYIFVSFDAINWTLKFPNGNKLEIPLWLFHTSVRFLSLWMPFALILIRWNQQKLPIAIIYISGCVCGIILTIASTVMIDDYKKAGQLKQEYVNLLKEDIKRSGSEFSFQVIMAFMSEDCCGWSGPIDFGPAEVIDISNKVDTDLEFMKQVAKCYGDTFVVEKGEDNGLIYKSHTGTLPKGCDIVYKNLVRRICYVIGCGGIIIDIIAVTFIVLYILIIYDARKARVAPMPQPTEGDGEEVDTFEEDQDEPEVRVNRNRLSLPPPDPNAADGGAYIHVLPPPPSDYTMQLAQQAKVPRKSHGQNQARKSYDKNKRGSQ